MQWGREGSPRKRSRAWNQTLPVTGAPGKAAPAVKGGTRTQPAKRTLAAADGRKRRFDVSASKLPVPSHRVWLRPALAGDSPGVCTTRSSRESHTYQPGSAHWATLNKQRDSVSRAMSPQSGHPGAPQIKASTSEAHKEARHRERESGEAAGKGGGLPGKDDLGCDAGRQR